ncbi:excisionase family DNA-binding protein [Microbacterium sp. NPDC089696]|uniref:excisionase family DNA-binding protein n=1 Tax=Microbacterium sp. NPDC089696 TaxID=3364199 RepID=UPI0037FDA34E
MNLVSVVDAASQLGVSDRRVRAMLQANEISGERVGRQWLVDAASLPAAVRRSGQPFSPRIAWALMEVADGHVPEWLGYSELSRLRSRWRDLLEGGDPVDVLRSSLSRRAHRSRWSAPEPDGLFRDARFIASGKSDPRAGISATKFAEGYVHSDDLESLVRRHMLIPARGPENVVLRAVDGPVPSPAPWLAVVADLSEGGAREKQQADILFKKEASLV